MQFQNFYENVFEDFALDICESMQLLFKKIVTGNEREIDHLQIKNINQ